MSTARSTFSKRNREANLKEKARIKEERRAAKRGEVRTSKGPEIAWAEAVHAVDSALDEPAAPEEPSSPPEPAPAPVVVAPVEPAAPPPPRPAARAAPRKR
jgi:hypothetical protein